MRTNALSEVLASSGGRVAAGGPSHGGRQREVRATGNVAGRSKLRGTSPGGPSYGGGGHLQQPRRATGGRSHGERRRRGESRGGRRRGELGRTPARCIGAIMLRESEKKKKKKEKKKNTVRMTCMVVSILTRGRVCCVRADPNVDQI
jgi:hypothetical protein